VHFADEQSIAAPKRHREN